MPIEQERGSVAKLGKAPHIGAKQRQLAREQVAQIELRGKACGRTTGDEPSARRQRPHAAFPRGFAHVFDDDVGATTGSGAPDVPCKVAAVMIEDRFSAQFAGAADLLRRGGRKYAGTEM